MPQYLCRCIVALVIACLGSWAFAVVTPTPLEVRKCEIIQETLARQSEPLSHERSVAAAQQAETLLMFQPGNANIAACYTLSVTGAPPVTAFALDQGKRIVLDFSNTVNLCADQTFTPTDTRFLKDIRTSLYAIQPKLISRVVFDLTQAATHTLEKSPNGMRLQIHPTHTKDSRVSVLTVDILYHAAMQPNATAFNTSIDTLAEALETAPVNFDNATQGKVVPSLFLLSQDKVFPEEWMDAPQSFAPELPSQELASVNSTYATQWKMPADVILAALEESQEEQAQEEGALEESQEDTATETADSEETQEENIEESVPEEETAPAPPSKREEERVDTTEANSVIVKKMRTLIQGLGANGDPVAAEGLTSAEESATEHTPNASDATTEPSTELEMANAEPVAEPASAAQEPSLPATQPMKPTAPKPVQYKGDPMAQLVNVDFREMELSNVVALLAHKAGVNVIAGTDLAGIVTANLRNVPLRQAMETALRMNGLGMLEEEGIYHIVPYEEAVSAQRTTMMITLENAKAQEVRTVLEEIVKGSPEATTVSISSNDTANVVVIAGPEAKLDTYIAMARDLDVAEPVLPTITKAIKLNYAEPETLLSMVEKMLTPDVGNVASDERARHIIVTDVPVVVEQISQLVHELDIAVKQVVIETMVVDVLLNDEAETGVDWLLESVRRQSTRAAIEDPGGVAVGNLQELSLDSNMSIGDAAGLLNFGVLSDRINWNGVIQAEVRNRNGRLLSNPVVVTVENKPANITISQEVPYVELTQTQQGGQQTSTEFKEIGTVMQVTPRVTHDKHIILDLNAKESQTSGEFNGVPIEDKRSVESTLRMKNGQTVFVGGLRKKDNDTTIRKVPVLGDLPVMNVMFRSNQREERVNELIVFLTCTVLDEELPDLTPYQTDRYKEIKGLEMKVDAQNALVDDMVHPGKFRDPIWKWRRSE